MVENTLFYSRHCQHCKNFILQLKNNDLLNYFTKKICVDDPQIRRRLPKYVKEVPTIIVEDYDKPLGADFSFKWIVFKIKERQNAEAQRQAKTQHKQGHDTQSNVCVPGAMDCYGDQFGGLSETGDNFIRPEQYKTDGEGKTIATSINYDAFSLINPDKIKLGQDGKPISSEINYDAYSITGGADIKAQVQSNSGGAIDSDYDKLMKMREMDDSFFGNNGKMRQG